MSDKDAANNSFHSLVSGISSDERKILLDKIRSAAGSLDMQTLESPFAINDDLHISLAEELKSEFFLYKIWLWLRSMIKGLQPEDLYASDKIAHLASEISQVVPGMLNYNHQCLTTSFYDRILELKDCAEFFRPYMANIQSRIGEFYVYLGSFIIPSIGNMLSTEADPFSTPPKPNVTNEHKSALLRKFDEILKDIPPVSRKAMYNAVISVEWLRKFSSLPFEKFLHNFVNLVDDTYVCSFDQITDSFAQIVSVLNAGKTVSPETLEALFLFASTEKDKEQLETFARTANSYLSILHTFIVAVPLVSIAKIAFNDYCWQPSQFGGGEDWFVKYKAEWKKRFDLRWEDWSAECRKEEQRVILKEKFNLDSFPIMPERPWSVLWGGLPFRYELTGGFLCWYSEFRFPKDIRMLKMLQLEGDFTNSENKEELTSSLNDLAQIDLTLKKLIKDLKIDGEMGLIFDRLTNEKLRTIKTQGKIDLMINTCEQQIKETKLNFCDAIRSLILVLQGVFDESTDKKYGSIHNLSTIFGGQNQSYVSDLHGICHSFKDMLQIISGIEMIENSSKK